MFVCFSNLLPHGEYSDLLVVAAFPNKSFSCKISSVVKKLCLTKIPDDETGILGVYLLSFFYSILLLIILVFSLIIIL